MVSVAEDKHQHPHEQEQDEEADSAEDEDALGAGFGGRVGLAFHGYGSEELKTSYSLPAPGFQLFRRDCSPNADHSYGSLCSRSL